jgi:hypothetical protein
MSGADRTLREENEAPRDLPAPGTTAGHSPVPGDVMRRHSLHAVAATATLLLLAAACTADPPSGPSRGLEPSRAITIAYPACDPSGIRGTMASLFQTTDLKKLALPTFNSAESYRQAGNVAAARTQYFTLVRLLLTRFDGDRLQQPSKFASVQDGVFFVMASVLACAGDPPIDDLETLIVGIGNDSPNYEICVVLATTAGATCVAPSGGAAVRLDANYLLQEALILLQPDLADLDVPLFEDDLGTTWSDVWRLRIEPLTAQRNHGVASPPASDPKRYAAVCTIDKYDDVTHEKLTASDLLRLGYRADVVGPEAVLLPVSNVATALLDCDDYEPVWDEGPGTSVVARATVLDAAPTRLALRGLRDAGGHLASLFTATPLHAFDGGIGGSFFSTESYFSAVELQVVYTRLDPSTETQGPLPTLTLVRQQSLDVVGSRTAYGVVRDPDSCTWASSHNRVSVVPLADGSPYATLVAGNSTGTAVVTATCTYRSVTSSYATTVTVVAES